MKNLNKLTTDNIQRIKTGMIRAVNEAILDDKEKECITKKIEELSNEIGKRLQLTLDFNEETNDGAYCE